MITILLTILFILPSYGNIISTKAILDKETNKCRGIYTKYLLISFISFPLFNLGYGFVDFEHPISAENAVKSLLSQGVQAQMAKCTDTNRNKNQTSKPIVSFSIFFKFSKLAILYRTSTIPQTCTLRIFP